MSILVLLFLNNHDRKVLLEYFLHLIRCESSVSNKKWGDRKAKLTTLSISTTAPSNFYKINEELQHICDINKHGDGRAKAKLLVIRPVKQN